MLQLLFFGVSSFFSYVSYKNDEIVKKKFTESEIQTLKSIANSAINNESIEVLTMIIIGISISRYQASEEIPNTKIQLKEKLNNIKNLVSDFGRSFQYEINHSDEVVFDQFSRLASPEMIAMEHTISKKSNLMQSLIKKDLLFHITTYRSALCCPKNEKKLKIINFTNKLDQEILQLVSVFRIIKAKT